MGENSIQTWPVSDKEAKGFCSCNYSLELTVFCLKFHLYLVLVLLCSLHTSSLDNSPCWVWAAPHCSFIYQQNSAAAVLLSHCAGIHNLRHKTMSAGRLLPASCTALCSVILAALKEKLCNHTYSITCSLASPSPPENWISTVVLCDVPVPDKSLTSLYACIWTQTNTGCWRYRDNSIVFVYICLNAFVHVFCFHKCKKKHPCIIPDLAEALC